MKSVQTDLCDITIWKGFGQELAKTKFPFQASDFELGLEASVLYVCSEIIKSSTKFSLLGDTNK